MIKSDSFIFVQEKLIFITNNITNRTLSSIIYCTVKAMKRLFFLSVAQNATVSSHLEVVGLMLQKAVDGIEYLAQGFPDDGQQDQVFRYLSETKKTSNQLDWRIM